MGNGCARRSLPVQAKGVFHALLTVIGRITVVARRSTVIATIAVVRRATTVVARDYGCTLAEHL